jgi:murein lipoprotein
MTASTFRIAPAAMVLIGSLALSGCATKKFVREQVAVVSQRVDALEAKLQQTDATAQAAAGQAQNNGQRIDQLTSRVDGIEQRMQEAERKRARN